MTKRETYEKKAEELLLPMMEENGFELVDVEYVKEGGSWYLRAYIDKPGGIAINDCEVISRALSDKLDEEDFIEQSYYLDVSSPGIGRELKRDKHFELSKGKEVRISLIRPDESGKKKYIGILKDYSDNTVKILADDKEMDFAMSAISFVKLNDDKDLEGMIGNE